MGLNHAFQLHAFGNGSDASQKCSTRSSAHSFGKKDRVAPSATAKRPILSFWHFASWQSTTVSASLCIKNDLAVSFIISLIESGIQSYPAANTCDPKFRSLIIQASSTLYAKHRAPRFCRNAQCYSRFTQGIWHFTRDVEEKLRKTSPAKSEVLCGKITPGFIFVSDVKIVDQSLAIRGTEIHYLSGSGCRLCLGRWRPRR